MRGAAVLGRRQWLVAAAGLVVRSAGIAAVSHSQSSRPGACRWARRWLSSMAPWYIGAVDQGTTSTRFIIYDQDAQPVASHQIEFEQLHPKQGWVEHDPMLILQTVHDCMEGALSKAADKGVAAKDIRAVGIANQRETTVVWDKETGKPLHNAIVWLDLRTSALCRELEAQHYQGRDAFREVTGLPISTYFSAIKLKWLLENVPEVAEAVKAERALFGTVDSWLLYKLCGGVHVTDVSNAARTLLLDLKTLDWHAETANKLGIPLAMLPAVRSNAEVYGHIDSGSLKGVPISGCLGDQHAAMLGQRCLPGEAKNTYGTGCFMLLNTGEEIKPSSSGLLTTVCYRLGREAKVQYALEGSVAMAGAAVQWLRDNLGIIDDVKECEVLAQTVPNSAGVVFVPAFQGLLAPHWRADARGVCAGLTRYSNKAHIARAVLEAIAFQVKEVGDAMKSDAQLKVLRVDGGASQSGFLMQLQADISGITVERPQDVETTALGAALAAGLGAGLWTDAQVFKKLDFEGDSFTPSISMQERDAMFARWEKAIKCSFDWAHE